MQHYILRCKHCHKEYTYCTYGNGPEYRTEEGCSMDYCAECQKAIDGALGKIPVRFEGRLQSINEPRLLPLLDSIREKVEGKLEEGYFNFGKLTKMYCCGNYDNYDTYTHNGLKFEVAYNDDTPNDKHISVEMEYDLTEKKFTGKPWKGDYEDSYIHGRNTSRDFARAIREKTFEPKAMEPPCGNLFFNDFMWDIVPPIKEAPKPKEHKLTSYKTSNSGIKIKLDCEHGYGSEHKSVFLENVDKNSLIDFLEYEYVVEYYEDEDIVYYTDIHCI